MAGDSLNVDIVVRALDHATGNLSKVTGKLQQLIDVQGTARASTKTLAREQMLLSQVYVQNSSVANRMHLSSVTGLRRAYSRLGQEFKLTTVATRQGARTLDSAGLGMWRMKIKADLAVRTIDNMSRNFINLGKNAQWTGRQLMVGVSAPLVLIGSQAIKAYKEVAEVDLRLRKLSNGQGLGVLNKQAEDLAVTFGVANVELKEVQSTFAQVGFNTKTIEDLTRLTVEFSKLGDVDLGTSGEMIRMLQQTGVEGNKLIDTLERLNLIEDKTNLSMKEIATAMPKIWPIFRQSGDSPVAVAAMLAGITQGGFEATEAANALKMSLTKLKPALASLDDSTDGGTRLKALRESINEINKMTGIGISFEDPNTGKMRKGVDMLVQLAQAYAVLNENQNLAGAKQLQEFIRAAFGAQQGGRMLQFLDATSKGLDARTAAGQDVAKALAIEVDATNAASDAWKRQLSIVKNADITKYQSQIEQLKILGQQFGKTLLPFVIDILDKLNTVLKKFSAMSQQTKDKIVKLAIAIGLIGPATYVFAQSLLTVGQAFRILFGPFNALLRILPRFKDLGDGATGTALAVGKLLDKVKSGEITVNNFGEAVRSLNKNHIELNRSVAMTGHTVEQTSMSYKRMAAASGAATAASGSTSVARDRIRETIDELYPLSVRSGPRSRADVSRDYGYETDPLAIYRNMQRSNGMLALGSGSTTSPDTETTLMRIISKAFPSYARGNAKSSIESVAGISDKELAGWANRSFRKLSTPMMEGLESQIADLDAVRPYIQDYLETFDVSKVDLPTLREFIRVTDGLVAPGASMGVRLGAAVSAGGLESIAGISGRTFGFSNNKFLESLELLKSGKFSEGLGTFKSANVLSGNDSPSALMGVVRQLIEANNATSKGTLTPFVTSSFLEIIADAGQGAIEGEGEYYQQAVASQQRIIDSHKEELDNWSTWRQRRMRALDLLSGRERLTYKERVKLVKAGMLSEEDSKKFYYKGKEAMTDDDIAKDWKRISRDIRLFAGPEPKITRGKSGITQELSKAYLGELKDPSKEWLGYKAPLDDPAGSVARQNLHRAMTNNQRGFLMNMLGIPGKSNAKGVTGEIRDRSSSMYPELLTAMGLQTSRAKLMSTKGVNAAIMAAGTGEGVSKAFLEANNLPVEFWEMVAYRLWGGGTAEQIEGLLKEKLGDGKDIAGQRRAINLAVANVADAVLVGTSSTDGMDTSSILMRQGFIKDRIELTNASKDNASRNASNNLIKAAMSDYSRASATIENEIITRRKADLQYNLNQAKKFALFGGRNLNDPLKNFTKRGNQLLQALTQGNMTMKDIDKLIKSGMSLDAVEIAALQSQGLGLRNAAVKVFDSGRVTSQIKKDYRTAASVLENEAAGVGPGATGRLKREAGEVLRERQIQGARFMNMVNASMGLGAIDTNDLDALVAPRYRTSPLEPSTYRGTPGFAQEAYVSRGILSGLSDGSGKMGEVNTKKLTAMTKMTSGRGIRKALSMMPVGVLDVVEEALINEVTDEAVLTRMLTSKGLRGSSAYRAQVVKAVSSVVAQYSISGSGGGLAALDAAIGLGGTAGSNRGKSNVFESISAELPVRRRIIRGRPKKDRRFKGARDLLRPSVAPSEDSKAPGRPAVWSDDIIPGKYKDGSVIGVDETPGGGWGTPHAGAPTARELGGNYGGDDRIMGRGGLMDAFIEDRSDRAIAQDYTGVPLDGGIYNFRNKAVNPQERRLFEIMKMGGRSGASKSKKEVEAFDEIEGSTLEELFPRTSGGGIGRDAGGNAVSVWDQIDKELREEGILNDVDVSAAQTAREAALNDLSGDALAEALQQIEDDKEVIKKQAIGMPRLMDGADGDEPTTLDGAYRLVNSQVNAADKVLADLAQEEMVLRKRYTGAVEELRDKKVKSLQDALQRIENDPSISKSRKKRERKYFADEIQGVERTAADEIARREVDFSQSAAKREIDSRRAVASKTVAERVKARSAISDAQSVWKGGSVSGVEREALENIARTEAMQGGLDTALRDLDDELAEKKKILDQHKTYASSFEQRLLAHQIDEMENARRRAKEYLDVIEATKAEDRRRINDMLQARKVADVNMKSVDKIRLEEYEKQLDAELRDENSRRNILRKQGDDSKRKLQRSNKLRNFMTGSRLKYDPARDDAAIASLMADQERDYQNPIMGPNVPKKRFGLLDADGNITGQAASNVPSAVPVKPFKSKQIRQRAAAIEGERNFRKQIIDRDSALASNKRAINLYEQQMVPRGLMAAMGLDVSDIEKAAVPELQETGEIDFGKDRRRIKPNLRGNLLKNTLIPGSTATMDVQNDNVERYFRDELMAGRSGKQIAGDLTSKQRKRYGRIATKVFAPEDIDEIMDFKPVKERVKKKGKLFTRNLAEWAIAPQGVGRGALKGPGAIARTAGRGVAKGFGLGGIVKNGKIGTMLGGLPGGGMATTMLSSMASMLPVIALVAGAVLMIWKNWDKVSKGIGDGISKVKEAFGKLIGAVIGPFINMWKRLQGEGDKGGKGMGKTWENVGKLIQKVMTGVAFALNLIAKIAGPIFQAIAIAVEVVARVVMFLVNVFTGDFSGALQQLGEIWNVVFEGFRRVAAVVVEQVVNSIMLVPRAIFDMVNAVVQMMPDAIVPQSWKDGLNGFEKGLDNIDNKIGDFVRGDPGTGYDVALNVDFSEAAGVEKDAKAIREAAEKQLFDAGASGAKVRQYGSKMERVFRDAYGKLDNRDDAKRIAEQFGAAYIEALDYGASSTRADAYASKLTDEMVASYQKDGNWTRAEAIGKEKTAKMLESIKNAVNNGDTGAIPAPDGSELEEGLDEISDEAQDKIDRLKTIVEDMSQGWAGAIDAAFEDWAESIRDSAEAAAEAKIDSIDGQIKAIDDLIAKEEEEEYQRQYAERMEDMRRKKRNSEVVYNRDRGRLIYEGKYDEALDLDFKRQEEVIQENQEEEDLGREHAKHELDFQRNAQKEALDIQKEGIEKALENELKLQDDMIEIRKAGLENELELLNRYAPRSQEEAAARQQAMLDLLGRYTDGHGKIGLDQAVAWGTGFASAFGMVAADIEAQALWMGRTAYNQFAAGLGLDPLTADAVHGNVPADNVPFAQSDYEQYRTPSFSPTNDGGYSDIQNGVYGSRPSSTRSRVGSGGGGGGRTPLYLHTGGPVGNASMGPSDVPATLQTGEYVVKRSTVAKLGTKALDALNTGRQIYHAGGLVMPMASKMIMSATSGLLGGTSSIGGITADVVKQNIMAKAQMLGYMNTMGSYAVEDEELNRGFDSIIKSPNVSFAGAARGLRQIIGLVGARVPGSFLTSVNDSRHAQGSLHYQGRAADFDTGIGAANARNEDIWRVLEPLAQQGILEQLFWDNKSYFSGVRGGSVAGHWNHTHAGIAQAFVNGIPTSMNGGGFAPTTDTSTGSGIKDIVRGMMSQWGWGQEHWPSLDKLIQGESSWNPNAANPTSSARGLFQKMTSIHGPVEPTVEGQTQWGFNYIKNRREYGDPSAAYAKWLSRSPHWYHMGGLVELAKGGHTLTDGLAKLHKGETVLTKPLSQKLNQGIDNMDAEGGLHLHFEGGYFGTDVELNKLVKRIESIQSKTSRAKGFENRKVSSF